MSQNLSSAAVVIGALRDNIVGVLNRYCHIAAIELVIKGYHLGTTKEPIGI